MGWNAALISSSKAGPESVLNACHSVQLVCRHSGSDVVLNLRDLSVGSGPVISWMKTVETKNNSDSGRFCLFGPLA